MAPRPPITPTNDFDTDDIIHLHRHDGEIANILEKIKSCYSSLRYEEFQTAVKKVSKEATKEYLEAKSWKNKTFWLPIWISIVSILVAIGSVIVAIVAIYHHP